MMKMFDEEIELATDRATRAMAGRAGLARARMTQMALACMLLATGAAQAQSNAELAAEMARMRDELRQVKAELEAVKRQGATAPPAPADGKALATTAAPAEGKASATTAAPAEGKASATTAAPSEGRAWATTAPASVAATSPWSLFGYGEMSLTRPRGNASGTMATVGRGVLGLSYRFNERTRLVSELEIENAVVSAGDQGEIALEQFYIEHDLSERISAKLGLFLMPVGYLNETHEPTRYFGVHRNLVETAIIPTTWRELGLGLRGNLDSGLRWDAGLVTGFDLGKWDATSSDGKASPLGAIHQEGQLAKAATLAFYGALNYNGVPGLNVGGSLYSGGAGQKQAGFAGGDARVMLGELHARWQPGRWDLSGLIASGRFSNVAALNATFAGQNTPVPERFGGWYLQSAYRLWQRGEYSLVPFARYERLNTARAYEGLAAGLAPAIEADTRVMTLGASFYLNPQVVLKLDAQRYLNNSALDRFNLGLGFHF